MAKAGSTSQGHEWLVLVIHQIRRFPLARTDRYDQCQNPRYVFREACWVSFFLSVQIRSRFSQWLKQGVVRRMFRATLLLQVISFECPTATKARIEETIPR